MEYVPFVLVFWAGVLFGCVGAFLVLSRIGGPNF